MLRQAESQDSGALIRTRELTNRSGGSKCQVWPLNIGSVALAKIEVQCRNCQTPITAQVYSAGLSDWNCWTCDQDSTVLTISTWNQTLNRKLESILGSYPNRTWTENQIALVEAQLKPCPCGGTFRMRTDPKCPKCGTVLQIARRKQGEVAIISRHIDGDKQDPWL